MRESNLLEQLQSFVDLQVSLVAAFHKNFPEVTDLQFMLDAPKTGCVETPTGLWLFKKHGGGLAFKNWDGITVDVHRCFGSPEAFDAWRIMQYLESISQFNDDEDEDDSHGDSDQVDHRQVESELADLASSGQLSRDAKNVYRLAGKKRPE